MRHHIGKDENFKILPIEFNNNTDKSLLAYCLGAVLYMPANKDISNKIINKELEGLTTITMCFEDAIDENSLEEAENNVIKTLNTLLKNIKDKNFLINDMPLFFLRVRNLNQFISFTQKLEPNHLKLITGFVFPKFNICNANGYFNHLNKLNKSYKQKLYGMPILETEEIMYKESRISNLVKLKEIVDKYKKLVLNIRVGGTDFSSLYGIRRGIDYTIYDVNVVRDCLTDILNIFNRNEDGYVISAPVWEYFSNENRLLKPQLREHPFNIAKKLYKRQEIINESIDGLFREVILDRANGFVGKTIIHPSHIKYVNALQCVSEEEYMDAMQILSNRTEGVEKSFSNNKMNEIKPHTSWAKKILLRAKAYGVVKDGKQIELFI